MRIVFSTATPCLPAPNCGALGTRVLISGHKGRTGQGRLYTPFAEALARADVLTLHSPLNARPRHAVLP